MTIRFMITVENFYNYTGKKCSFHFGKVSEFNQEPNNTKYRDHRFRFDVN